MFVYDLCACLEIGKARREHQVPSKMSPKNCDL